MVIDVETGGFDHHHDALLEIGAILLQFSPDGTLHCGDTLDIAVEPFPGANIDTAALNFTGIDLSDPDRGAIGEHDALRGLFQWVRREVRVQDCKRAIVVGHNAGFDHGFLFAAAERCAIKRNPFHPFSTFDTVPLAALAFGQTVLSNACVAAGLGFENGQAHRAAYDCQKTAELFCAIVNQWARLGGWP